MVQRTFLVSLLILANPWLHEVVEAQKKSPPSCSVIGEIKGSEQGRRNETCGIVVNYTVIEICGDDGWREICDRNFTEQDAKVTCRHLGFSDIGATAGRLDQTVGAFPSTFSPVCDGQEATLSECSRTDRNTEACTVGKAYVTCFTNDPVSGMPPCHTGEPPSSIGPDTVSELPTGSTSVAPPPSDTTSS